MLRELLEKNRSYRSFDPSAKISKEELLDMIDSTRLCPSSANLQSLKYRPVFEEKEVKAVFSATKWAGYLSNMEIPPKGHEPTAFIIILNDKNIAANTTPFFKDTGICAHTILLRACEMGYNGCMIGSFDKDIIKNELDLPKELEITLVVALGKGDEEIVLTDADESIKYYRDNSIHYVPKRSLEEITV